MNKRLVSILFSFPLLLQSFSFADLAEIRVELPTKTERSSLYISQFDAKQAAFSSQYLARLYSVLSFDLDHSGYAKVSSPNSKWEKELSVGNLQEAFRLEKWGKAGQCYVLKVAVKKEKLDLYALSVATGSVMQFEGIPLSGDHKIDRHQIHKLSDALVKSLFGGKGIATTRILYTLQQENRDPSEKKWKSEIWECDWDGYAPRQVTFEQGYSITPAFLPPDPAHGDDRFLYVNYKNGQPKIYYSTLGQRTGTPFLSLRGNQILPAICPKKDQMAFICDAAGRPDLFVQRLGPSGHPVGKPKQLFSYPRATQASPSFSPDGSRIAFVSDKGGTPRIYVIPSNEPSHRRPIATLLTKQCRENICPVWSPDGTKLAYSAKTNGVRQIWIYDFATKEEKQLTSGPGHKENPCWAPDSLHLVFNSTDPDASELYLINLHQAEAVKITKGTGRKHYPTWGI